MIIAEELRLDSGAVIDSGLNYLLSFFLSVNDRGKY